jgi:hypothetical protein
MRGAIPPLHQYAFMAWCLVKQRDNLTLTSIYIHKRCNTLVGKIKGKRPLRRPRRRWENTIRMILREIGWELWTRCIWFRKGTSGGLL